MEARDTVISSYERLNLAKKVFGSSDNIRPKFPTRGEQIQEFSLELADTQADISFKAGIGEVMEGLTEYIRLYGKNAIFPENWQTQYLPGWQAQLEKWGIK